MKKRRTLKNIIFGLLAQAIIMVVGILVPHFIINGYGSSINGLFSTSDQVFGYLVLIEAGLGTAVIQSLYTPTDKKDYAQISSILSASKKHYKKIAFWYFLAVLAISSLMPFVLKSNLPKIEIFLVFFFQGIAGVSTFLLQSTYKCLYAAEGKMYVINLISLMSHLLITGVKILLIYLKMDIVFLQTAYFVVIFIQNLCYYFYFQMKYKKLVDNKAIPDDKALSQRKDFLIHQIASVVFSSTGTIILSIFCGLEIASIYSVYSLVFIAIQTIVRQVFTGVQFNLGQSYNKGLHVYLPIHDFVESLIISISSWLITVAFILILPFVQLYTSGDAEGFNYINPYLPILFSCISFLTILRSTSSELINISGNAKRTISRAIAETAINLIVSLVLVQFIGIYGVLFGSLCALLYRSNDMIIFANLVVLKRKPTKTYLKAGSFLLLSLVLCLVFTFLIKLDVQSYGQFILWGFVLSIGFGILYSGLFCLFNLSIVKKVLKRKTTIGKRM